MLLAFFLDDLTMPDEDAVEIRELLASGKGKRAKQPWRDLVDGKLGEVDALIRQARAVRRLLKESRDFDCVTLENCDFLANERAMPRSTARMAALVGRHTDRN